MEQGTVFTILCSGLVGSFLVLLTTKASERFGGTIGGLVSTVPSVVLVSTIGLGLVAELENRDPADIRRAMYASPAAGFIINVYLFLVWIVLPRKLEGLNKNKQLAIILVCGLFIWCLLTLPWTLVLYPELLSCIPEENHLTISTVFLFATFYTGSLYQIKKIQAGSISRENPSTSKKSAKTNRSVIITRMAIGFIFVGGVSALGKVHTTLGAVLSVFPVLGTINQILLWRSSAGGADVVVALSGSMMIGGTSVYGYAMIFGALFEGLGVWKAAFLSLFLSMGIFSVPLFLVMQSKSTNSAQNCEAQMEINRYYKHDQLKQGKREALNNPTVVEFTINSDV